MAALSCLYPLGPRRQLIVSMLLTLHFSLPLTCTASFVDASAVGDTCRNFLRSIPDATTISSGLHCLLTRAQVRLSWLLPLRVVLLVGYGLFYRLSGLQHPWLQSAGVHATSFVVSWAVDARYRYIFAKRQLKGETRSEAARAARPHAASPVREAAAREAAAATAQGADQQGAEVQGAKGQQERQPAGAGQQTESAKDSLPQAEQPRQLQASKGAVIVGYLGKLALEVVSLAFTPLPCVLVAIHLVCEVPVYRSGGQTLTMALLKVGHSVALQGECEMCGASF
ncbi:hypothetical protein DUNSADRAFT_17946 [Dunaliella salina]|uniref:Encoded protein n=1 Tax=Dunaliella salina TaxID=3046 RepID=A0ABQ7H934_DUNSA|nr:hypothetical protein DUNSADRAFT_17946 [Dunaliella salina]|eukprot:KAF5843368.1 hypothetical protein DUNSADRAFT_17946 [Dunaliella salina]